MGPLMRWELINQAEARGERERERARSQRSRRVRGVIGEGRFSSVERKRKTRIGARGRWKV